MSNFSADACCSVIPLNTAAAVRERYSAAALASEAALCCPVQYDPRYLAVIPREVLEKDYGCGDPSRWLQSGETVLDLGSGGGKICFIAAQVVGAAGRVIGVDCNDEMLALAQRHRGTVGARLGYDNVEFRRGRIQDLALDLDRVAAHLDAQPVVSLADWLRLREHEQLLRRQQPLVADQSIDVVVSNCVLNLVCAADRGQLFRELHRVLRPGGRAVISDIVSNADVPTEWQQDAQLWSGCLSGAFREDRFADAFTTAGFERVEVVERQATPWTVIEGIEFRSITLRAWRAAAASLPPARSLGAAHSLQLVPVSTTPCCGSPGCCD